MRKAREEAEWVHHFGIDRVCTATAGGTAAEEIYSSKAELDLEDGELIKSRSNSTYAIQDFLPKATQILKANAPKLKILTTRLTENGRRVLAQVPKKPKLPHFELSSLGKK